MWSGIQNSLGAVAATVLPGIGWGALVVLAWRAGVRVSRIEEALDSIKNNHLPHLYVEIKSVRDDVRAMWSGRIERDE